MSLELVSSRRYSVSPVSEFGAGPLVTPLPTIWRYGVSPVNEFRAGTCQAL